VYENSLDWGGFFGDRQMEPICGYMSTGEFSTQSIDQEEAPKNRIVVLAQLITSIYSALHEIAVRGTGKSMSSTQTEYR
jgi:hypothetical protein